MLPYAHACLRARAPAGSRSGGGPAVLRRGPGAGSRPLHLGGTARGLTRGVVQLRQAAGAWRGCRCGGDRRCVRGLQVRAPGNTAVRGPGGGCCRRGLLSYRVVHTRGAYALVCAAHPTACSSTLLAAPRPSGCRPARWWGWSCRTWRRWRSGWKLYDSCWGEGTWWCGWLRDAGGGSQ